MRPVGKHLYKLLVVMLRVSRSSASSRGASPSVEEILGQFSSRLRNASAITAGWPNTLLRLLLACEYASWVGRKLVSLDGFSHWRLQLIFHLQSERLPSMLTALGDLRYISWNEGAGNLAASIRSVKYLGCVLRQLKMCKDWLNDASVPLVGHRLVLGSQSLSSTSWYSYSTLVKGQFQTLYCYAECLLVMREGIHPWQLTQRSMKRNQVHTKRCS